MEKLLQAHAAMTYVDAIAVVVFWTCWIGYRYLAEFGRRGEKGLVGVTHEYRLQWAMETPTREIPVACASLVANLMNSVSFYASTTIYIIAGLFALVGTVDQLEVFTSYLPFTVEGSRVLIEIKLLLLIIIFVVAYFKFTWSLRQFNFLCILIGAVPNENNMPSKAYWQKSADRMARINSLAGDDFNLGIRAYYYGIAALAWFIHPALFIASTLWVTFILFRRDFYSKALLTLRDEFPPHLSEPKYFEKDDSSN